MQTVEIFFAAFENVCAVVGYFVQTSKRQLQRKLNLTYDQGSLLFTVQNRYPAMGK